MMEKDCDNCILRGYNSTFCRVYKCRAAWVEMVSAVIPFVKPPKPKCKYVMEVVKHETAEESPM